MESPQFYGLLNQILGSEFTSNRIPVGSVEQAKTVVDSLSEMGVDLIKWLVGAYKVPPVAGLILDETTRYSSPGSVGVKKLRQWHKKLDWVLGLTAQPVMENPMALYGQVVVIDGGRALGRSYDRFKREYFMQMDYAGYDWELQPLAGERLAEAVSDVVYVMEDRAYAESLVPLTEEVVEVGGLPPVFQTAYASLCDEMIMEIEGGEVEAANEAVVSGKLEQLCQGAVYDNRGEPHWVHFAKMGALGALLGEMKGEPVIVTYSFIYELEALRERFPWGRDLKDTGALFCRKAAGAACGSAPRATYGTTRSS